MRSYSPYGETVQTLGDFQTDFSFTGEMTDASGLVYLRARYYAPNNGRFLSKDSWSGDYKNPVTLAKWLYANANPVVYADPSGRCFTFTSWGTFWSNLSKPPYFGLCPSGTYTRTGNSFPAPIIAHATSTPTCTPVPIPTTTSTPTTTPTQTPTMTPTPVAASDPEVLKQQILSQFGIQMKESNDRIWKRHNLTTAYNALMMVNNKIGPKFRNWMNGKAFIITDGGNQYSGWAHSWGVEFRTASSDTSIPVINFLHETGHVIDYSNNSAFSKPLDPSRGGSTPIWVKDGYVNKELLLGLFNEPVQSEPLGEINDPYEYWADGFANFAGDNINVDDTTGAGRQMFNDIQAILNQ